MTTAVKKKSGSKSVMRISYVHKTIQSNTYLCKLRERRCSILVWDVNLKDNNAITDKLSSFQKQQMSNV